MEIFPANPVKKQDDKAFLILEKLDFTYMKQIKNNGNKKRI